MVLGWCVSPGVNPNPTLLPHHVLAVQAGNSHIDTLLLTVQDGFNWEDTYARSLEVLPLEAAA